MTELENYGALTRNLEPLSLEEIRALVVSTRGSRYFLANEGYVEFTVYGWRALGNFYSSGEYALCVRVAASLNFIRETVL